MNEQKKNNNNLWLELEPTIKQVEESLKNCKYLSDDIFNVIESVKDNEQIGIMQKLVIEPIERANNMLNDYLLSVSNSIETIEQELKH